MARPPVSLSVDAPPAPAGVVDLVEAVTQAQERTQTLRLLPPVAPTVLTMEQALERTAAARRRGEWVSAVETSEGWLVP